jgi:hypothetical protein
MERMISDREWVVVIGRTTLSSGLKWGLSSF